MNILVTGALGQLGRSIQEANKTSEDNLYLYTDILSDDKVSELDITSKEDVENFVSTNKINMIVNCAAYTNVEMAETAVGFSCARKLNALAVKNLAECAKRHGARMIHISTDYVFDGEKNTPYTETDMTNPKNAYGITKKEGEEYALSILKDNCIIIRTSWLYSTFGNNFVKTIRRLINEKDEINVTLDEVGSPTYAGDLAWTIVHIIEHWDETENAGGIYHYSNEGVVSRYDFAETIRDYEFYVIGNSRSEFVSMKPCISKNLGLKLLANRPKYSVMLKDKIKEKFGIEIPYWRESLFNCVDRMQREETESNFL